MSRGAKDAAPSSLRPPEVEETRAPSSSLEDFPSDVPIYPGAMVFASHQTIAHLAVTFTTSDGLPHVLAFYRERLPQEQWVVHEQKAGEEAPILEGRKGSRTCRVELTEDHARTYITVTLSLDSETRRRK